MFSSVVKPVLIRLIFTVVVSKGWSIVQIYASKVFLQGDLDERSVVSQPSGFVNPEFPNHVSLLKKALYSLIQEPFMWFHRLKSFLFTLNFVQSMNDSSLFLLNQNGEQVFIFVYVDNLVITSSKDELIEEIVSKLEIEFLLPKLGDLSFFLGIQVKKTSLGLFLSQ